jgi:hypothetical protein
MFSIASKYDLPTLMTAAAKKYNEVIQSASFGSKDLANAIAIAYNTGYKDEAEMREAVVASTVQKLKLSAKEECI